MTTLKRIRRRAFTLVELLVVIGIVTILIGILIPTIRSARLAAKNTVCSSNLRQLVAGCTMYLHEHRRYPPAPFVPLQGEVICHMIPYTLLNQLSRYVDYAPVSDTALLAQLPAVVQCPFAQEIEIPNLRGPVPLPGGVVTLTGYQYTAGLCEDTDVRGVRIREGLVPPVKAGKRGVLFSDALTWYSGSGVVFLPPVGPPAWAYFHFAGAVVHNGIGFSDTKPLRGQHRAWTDGSVEWVPAGLIDLNVVNRDFAASYKSGPSGNYCAYYWF